MKVLAGVTIGDDTIIGAGSVVTKDIPSGVIAAGNPCRVLRVIGAGERTERERHDWNTANKTAQPRQHPLPGLLFRFPCSAAC